MSYRINIKRSLGQILLIGKGLLRWREPTVSSKLDLLVLAYLTRVAGTYKLTTIHSRFTKAKVHFVSELVLEECHTLNLVTPAENINATKKLTVHWYMRMKGVVYMLILSLSCFL